MNIFVQEMKSQGLWDDTVIVIGSDFGRTMNSNSGDGEYHYFYIGYIRFFDVSVSNTILILSHDS